MGVADRTLADTRHAFDGVAADYHRSNAGNPALGEMRRRVLAAVVDRVPAGSHILDLGCGPGTDDEVLGRAGYLVTGIDWSPAMVAEAGRRIDEAGLRSRVEVRHLGIHELDRLHDRVFDAACSNFGPLNCVPDLGRAARALAGRLRPGGWLVASVIGRICPWELAICAARGTWSRARVRFQAGMVPVPLSGRTVWTQYYTPGEFARPFEAAGFERIEWRALGLVAPPPYLDGFAARHARLTRALHRVDDAIGAWPGLRAWGDHFLMVLAKR